MAAAAAPGKEAAGKDAAPAQPKSTKVVPYFSLFRTASTNDLIMYTVGFIFAMAQGVVFPMFTFIFSGLLDAFFDPANFISVVERYALYMFYVGLAMFVASFISMAGMLIAAENQAKKIRYAYLRATLSQEVAWHDVNHTGEIASRLSEDVTFIYEGIGDKAANFVQFGTQFIAGIIMGLVRGPILALVVISFLPVLAISAGAMKVIMTSMQKREADAYARAGEIATETISNIRVVAANGQEAAEIKRYDSHLSAAQRAGIQKSWAVGASMGFVWLGMMSAYAVGLWYGSQLILKSRQQNGLCRINPVLDGCFSGGQVVSVFFAIIISGFAVAQAAPNISAFGTAQAAGARIFEVLDRKSKNDSFSEEGLKPDAATVRGEIEFQDVTFAYPSRPEDIVLRNFSLRIAAGENVALTGPSGCGKSTLIALLQRWYEPLTGRILLDGVDIRDYNVQWLRDRMGLVLQEPILFAVSIRENIALGKPGVVAATEDEVLAAAKAANADGFIQRLQAKYDTSVGERGSQLSGGQKQRIAIARAIIRNPNLLLFDEATSALDSRSEKKVQAAIDSLLQNAGARKRSSITIAHRLSTITRADRIVVMRDGAIVEQGTHAELMANATGTYRRMREAQDLRDAEAAVHVNGDDGEDDVGNGSTTNLPGLISAASLPALDVAGDAAVSANVKTPPAALVSRRASATTGATPVGAATSAEATSKKDDKKTDAPDYAPVGFMRVFNYQWSEAHWIVIGLLFNAVTGVSMPIFSIVFARITAVYYSPDDAYVDSSTRFYMGMFFVIGVGSFLGHFLSNGLLGYAGEQLTRRLRVASYTALLRHNVGFFDLKENMSGALTARLATDAALVKATTGEKLGVGLMSISSLIAGLVIAFTASWQLSLLVLALFPVIAAMGAVQIRIFTGMTSKTENQETAQIAAESTSGIRTVLAFGLQSSVMSKFDAALIPQLKRGYQRAVYSGAAMGASMAVMFFSYSLCFWVGAKLIENKSITFQDMLQAFFAIIMAGQGIGNAAALATDAGKAERAKRSIFALIDAVEKGVVPIDSMSAHGERPASCAGRIEFSNIKFRYPARPEQLALNGFNLVVEPGTTVALCGPSGCGKSTVIQLLERFYDPEEGSVTVDGHNVKELNPHWLRGQAALVQQEPVLWADSIAYNIEYGSASTMPVAGVGVSVDAGAGSVVPASFKLLPDVVHAAQDANAHDFVLEFPSGYATHVGDRGSMLSGGQKQRVAIARALYRKPRVLLLDEATSALDSRSEQVVQAALDRLLATHGDLTKIIIAHRLTTIRNADKIVVIDGGAVVEQGTHDELMARGGLYRELAMAQDAGMMQRVEAAEGAVAAASGAPSAAT